MLRFVVLLSMLSTRTCWRLSQFESSWIQCHKSSTVSYRIHLSFSFCHWKYWQLSSQFRWVLSWAVLATGGFSWHFFRSQLPTSRPARREVGRNSAKSSDDILWTDTHSQMIHWWKFYKIMLRSIVLHPSWANDLKQFLAQNLNFLDDNIRSQYLHQDKSYNLFNVW